MSHLPHHRWADKLAALVVLKRAIALPNFHTRTSVLQSHDGLGSHELWLGARRPDNRTAILDV